MQIHICIPYFDFLVSTPGVNRFLKWKYAFGITIENTLCVKGLIINLWIVKLEFLFKPPFSWIQKPNK